MILIADINRSWQKDFGTVEGVLQHYTEMKVFLPAASPREAKPIGSNIHRSEKTNRENSNGRKNKKKKPARSRPPAKSKQAVCSTDSNGKQEAMEPLSSSSQLRSSIGAMDDDEDLCIVCFEHPRRAVVIPCGKTRKCATVRCITAKSHSYFHCGDLPFSFHSASLFPPTGHVYGCVECTRLTKHCAVCRGPVSDCVRLFYA